MRLVGLPQVGGLVLVEFDVHRGDRVGQLGGLVTPTMGEVTAGLRMTQAKATWAGDRPRLPAISWTRSATAWSSSR